MKMARNETTCEHALFPGPVVVASFPEVVVAINSVAMEEDMAAELVDMDGEMAFSPLHLSSKQQ